MRSYNLRRFNLRRFKQGSGLDGSPALEEERKRGRARVLDQRELAPLPGEGWCGDPMPLPSPEESGMGSPSVVATEPDREDEAVAGPRLKRARRGGRAPRPSDDHRKANKRKNSEERGASSGE